MGPRLSADDQTALPRTAKQEPYSCVSNCVGAVAVECEELGDADMKKECNTCGL